MDCTHNKATIKLLEYTVPRWDSDSYSYANDDSEDLPTLVCPDCGLEELQQDD